MTTIQKYLMGLIGLSALWLVGTQAKGLAVALDAMQKFISGTDKTAMGRG